MWWCPAAGGLRASLKQHPGCRGGAGSGRRSARGLWSSGFAAESALAPQVPGALRGHRAPQGLAALRVQEATQVFRPACAHGYFVAPPRRSACASCPLLGPRQPPVPARVRRGRRGVGRGARVGWRASSPLLRSPSGISVLIGVRGRRPRPKPCCDRRERRPGDRSAGRGGLVLKKRLVGLWNMAGGVCGPGGAW